MTTGTGAVKLLRTQTGEAGKVLGRAFHDDPYWSWVLAGESKRARVLPWFMEVWVRYCFGYGEVYTTASNVEGVAVWLPPGRSATSPVPSVLTGMVLMPLKFGWADFSRFMSSVNYLDKLRERAVPSRHWNLPTLGVDPPRQGQGVGSALLQPALALADADGLPCYLETERERNVPFYNGHGFDVVVEIDLPKGGPHIWAMKREPRG
jgi:GNAT superfamily N-acetyltransferase